MCHSLRLWWLPPALFAMSCGCTWLDHIPNSSVLQDVSSHGYVAVVLYPNELKVFDGSRHAVRLECCGIVGGWTITHNRIAMVDLTSEPTLMDRLKNPALKPGGPVVLMNEKGEIVNRSEVKVVGDHLAISPDDSSFAITYSGSDVLVAGFKGTTVRHLIPYRIPRAEATGLASVDWSPDGTSLLVSGDGGIEIVDVRTGTSRKITDGGQARWSPSGDFISYVGPGHQATILNLKTNDRSLIDPRHGVAGPVEWSPDGRFLIVHEIEGSHAPYGCYWVFRLSDAAWLPIQYFGINGYPGKVDGWMIGFRQEN